MLSKEKDFGFYEYLRMYQKIEDLGDLIDVVSSQIMEFARNQPSRESRGLLIIFSNMVLANLAVVQLQCIRMGEEIIKNRLS
jgi:DNA-binding transcriptional regulator WhiA